MRARLIRKTIVAAALACTPAMATAAPQSIGVLAAYAIDADTYELVRYSFANNSFSTVGEVQTAAGVTLTDLESLGYLPPGSGAGMYSVPTRGPFRRQLVRIDPLTAIATVVGPAVVPAGRKITGMLSDYDPVAGAWYLLAASSMDQTSSRTAIETRELVRLNPLTGASTIVATQADLGNGLRFEGLGIDSTGTVYAASRTRFFRIPYDPVTFKYSVQEVGITGLDKAEAFEVAYGDTQASISIPGIDPSWTTNGVFFVADGQLQKFGVINPATGEFAEYMVGGVPSTFVTKDAEGLVLLTLANDPRWGVVSGD